MNNPPAADAKTQATVPTLADIRQALVGHQPPLSDMPTRESRAAVALILAGDPNDPAMCFIRRAEHDNDPWSGQMAFPGGRVEPTDADPDAAARRETLEEIGLDLSQSEPLGAVWEMPVYARGRDTGMALYSFLFVLAGSPPPLQLNEEVAEVYWLPLSALLDVANQDEIHYQRPELELDMRLPSIHLEGQHIWGLTYRMLRHFFGLLGHDLPEDPFQLRRVK